MPAYAGIFVCGYAIVLLLNFGGLLMNALIQFLDWVVRELEAAYYLERADYLCDYLDYLDATVFLDKIRTSDEYRMLH